MALLNKKKLKVVLALGGGGSRGLAHLGVLRALLESGIPISGIAGTSMGSVIGALYSETLDIEIMYERIESYLSSQKFREFESDTLSEQRFEEFWSNLFARFKKQVAVNLALQKISLGDAAELHNALDYLIHAKTFEDLQIPFTCVADDLKSGSKVVLKEGNLKPALIASSSVPGYLPPVEYGNYLLCDGMLTSVIPTIEAAELGDFIIAVDVRQDINYTEEFESALDILIRSDLISANFRADILGQKADALICPDVGEYGWNDFSNWRGIIEEGYNATVKAIPGIIKKLREKRTFIYRYGLDPLYLFYHKFIKQ
jgi:NTE family protein